MEPFLHPRAKQQVDGVIASPRGSVLLHGPAHVGKFTAALWVARCLNCEGCGDATCRSCKMLTAGNHPDVITVSPDEKGKIGIEQIHSLQHGLAYTQYQASGHRTVIIEDAHTMTLPAQNSLLKTLEEPPADTLILLTATNHTNLLPTIVSRCQMVYLPALATGQVAALLQSRGIKPDRAVKISELSQGAPGTALSYANDSVAFDNQVELSRLCQQLLEGKIFDRLIALANVDAKQAGALSEALSWELQKRLRIAPSKSLAEGLLAVKRYRERVMANVNPRTAAQALALELEC